QNSTGRVSTPLDSATGKTCGLFAPSDGGHRVAPGAAPPSDCTTARGASARVGSATARSAAFCTADGLLEPSSGGAARLAGPIDAGDACPSNHCVGLIWLWCRSP